MKHKFEWGDELPVIKGERICLRPLRSSDSEAIFGLFGDPEVMKFWGMPLFEKMKEATDFIQGTHEEFEKRTIFGWGMALQETDEIIGTTTLLNMDRDHKRSEIGCAVVRKHWASGYATEAATTLINFAFETLELHRIEADVDPNNTPSLRILEKLGFRREGLMRERWHQMGEIQDSVILGLLRPEWKG